MPPSPQPLRARSLLTAILLWDGVLLVLAAYFELTWRGQHAHRHLREVFAVWSEPGLVTWTRW